MTFSISKVLNAIGEKSANVRQQIPLITNGPKASPEINIFSINTDSDSVGSRFKIKSSHEVVATDSKAEFGISRTNWSMSKNGIVITAASCLLRLPLFPVMSKNFWFSAYQNTSVENAWHSVNRNN